MNNNTENSSNRNNSNRNKYYSNSRSKNKNNSKKNFRPHDNGPRKPYRRNYYKKNNNRNEDPIQQLFRKYDYLMDVYLSARKTHFELFYTENKGKKNKITDSYNTAISQLYAFKAKLTDDENKAFEQRDNEQPFDLEISNQNNNKHNEIESN